MGLSPAFDACSGCDSPRARNGSSRHGTLATTLIAPFLQILGELFLAEAIQDALFRDTALARHLDPPVRQINFARRMRIRIDAHHATKVERRLVPAPIKVKPPRICVDFNGDAVFGAGREDFLDIDVVPRTAQKLASGHMPKDGGIGIGDRADDALGLRRAVHFKLPVNACDDEIEAREHVFRIIE